MEDVKKKVYIYTCVSTAMQIDDYSLEEQRTRMKAFAVGPGKMSYLRSWYVWQQK